MFSSTDLYFKFQFLCRAQLFLLQGFSSQKICDKNVFALVFPKSRWKKFSLRKEIPFYWYQLLFLKPQSFLCSEGFTCHLLVWFASHLVILGHSLPDTDPDPWSWSYSQAPLVVLNSVLIPVKPSEGDFDITLAKSRI